MTAHAASSTKTDSRHCAATIAARACRHLAAHRVGRRRPAGVVLCVAETVDALDVEKCVTVSCEANGPVMGDVQVNGNDDGMGGKNALECIYTNNDAKAAPIECK